MTGPERYYSHLLGQLNFLVLFFLYLCVLSMCLPMCIFGAERVFKAEFTLP